VKGQLVWRQLWYRLHDAGFDVLALDRHGVCISGGYSDTNTLRQGRDLLSIVSALSIGKGMRALSPTGQLTQGHDAAALVRGGAPDAGLPALIMCLTARRPRETPVLYLRALQRARPRGAAGAAPRTGKAGSF
jgi:hypothetical protein